MNLDHIQEEIRRQRLDGWLFFDHHERDPLAYRILGLPRGRQVTRRWYYLIPANGEPIALVHRIESGVLDSLPGSKIRYSSWAEQMDGLHSLTQGLKKIAMQYSPHCAIPYVSLVDAGTLELVRCEGLEVVSSAELVQYFEARSDQAGLESHLAAGKIVDRVRHDAFAMIRERVRDGAPVDELTVRDFVLTNFSTAGLFTDHSPIVGVNSHAGNPHYEPRPETNRTIGKNDFVLLDMWAKLAGDHSIYYDITWTGYCGDVVPERIQTVFDIVVAARDQAIETVQRAFQNGQTIHGFEVDNAARNHINDKGYGPYFVHRTGHSIGRDVHGNGANMDNLETHDDRKLIPWTCFSIEPGIYLEDFGVRSEINIFIDANRARVTGEVQRELVKLV